jgi:hypothetical protein
MLLKEQVAKLEGQSKPDTKGKKKEKAGKSANLLARIDDILLESRMEDIDSYNERVFIAPKSNQTDVVKQIVDRMDVDNEDAVSLGNESTYSSKGIIHEYSAPHIHTQNGRAEALNRIILEKAESMRTHAECPQSWWEFSFHAAVHIYNRTPLRRTQWSTPYWNIFGKKPDVQYFKTFGCLAWVYKPKEVRKHKLDHRSEAMTFIGYEIGSKAYKFIRKDNVICIATHAWFDEEKFPRANSGDGSSKNKLKICPPSKNKDQEDDNYSTNPIQTLIITMMILIKRILQMIHLVIHRKSHHQKKKAWNQRMKKMKLRMISNHQQNPLTMKNLLPDILEEAVFTLLMKNLRKVVTTVVNLTKDHRAIPMILLKNLNLVQLKKKLDLKEHGKELLNQKLKP